MKFFLGIVLTFLLVACAPSIRPNMTAESMQNKGLVIGRIDGLEGLQRNAYFRLQLIRLDSLEMDSFYNWSAEKQKLKMEEKGSFSIGKSTDAPFDPSMYFSKLLPSGKYFLKSMIFSSNNCNGRFKWEYDGFEFPVLFQVYSQKVFSLGLMDFFFNRENVKEDQIVMDHFLWNTQDLEKLNFLKGLFPNLSWGETALLKQKKSFSPRKTRIQKSGKKRVCRDSSLDPLNSFPMYTPKITPNWR